MNGRVSETGGGGYKGRALSCEYALDIMGYEDTVSCRYRMIMNDCEGNGKINMRGGRDFVLKFSCGSYSRGTDYKIAHSHSI